MDGTTLADLRARRDALDEEIRVAEANDRDNWNIALEWSEHELVKWLAGLSIEYTRRDRKNETTWDIGHGALAVTFGADDGERARSLRMTSGRTLALEWSEVPDPARLLSIVAVLLGKSQ